ncbi:hypothetical protein D3C86_1298660 [compost metagenome]
MEAHRCNCILQWKLEVIGVADHLKDRGKNPRAAWCANDQSNFSVLQENCRRHRRQRTLSRFNRVGVIAHNPHLIRHTRKGGEVIHFVVEQNAGLVGDHTGAEESVERISVRDRIPPFVYD